MRALVGVAAASITDVDDVVTVPQLRVLVMLHTRGPMNLAAVAVIGPFVSLSRSEMKRTGNLLVEENVAHGFPDIGIEPKREFADVPSAFI